MTIQYASDLHLEFPENEFYVKNNPLKPGADILVLGGDIGLFKELPRYNWFFDYVSDNFGATYWIAGNHEYYHYDLADKRGTFYEAVRDNVFLVNDYAVTIENAHLIFSTMWTSVKPEHQFAIQRRMNDFHLIRMHGNRLTCDDLQQEHEASLSFIKRELAEETPDVKKVVVTHHVPTFINYPPEYFGDILNEAFAVDLTRLIQNNGPDYWIYGHHHQNIADFEIGRTKMLTNQLGYVRLRENALFSDNKTIDTGNHISYSQSY